MNLENKPRYYMRMQNCEKVIQERKKCRLYENNNNKKEKKIEMRNV